MTTTARPARKATASKPAPAKAAPKPTAKKKPAAPKPAPAAPTAPEPKAPKWDAKVLAKVVALRNDQLSWKKIAGECDLGSPGTARRAWRAATGHVGPLPRLEGKGGRIAAEEPAAPVPAPEAPAKPARSGKASTA